MYNVQCREIAPRLRCVASFTLAGPDVVRAEADWRRGRVCSSSCRGEHGRQEESRARAWRLRVRGAAWGCSVERWDGRATGDRRPTTTHTMEDADGWPMMQWSSPSYHGWGCANSRPRTGHACRPTLHCTALHCTAGACGGCSFQLR
jgi:hypothetical protein